MLGISMVQIGVFYNNKALSWACSILTTATLAYSGLFRSGQWLIVAVRDAPAEGPLSSVHLQRRRVNNTS